jgi:Tol biopolymer transport system component
MKQAETYWQGMVLVLVLLMTLGVWGVLGWLLSRPQVDRPVLASTQSPQPQYTVLPQYTVQILEPLDAAVLQRSPTIAVRAALMKRGFVRAELHVDGRRASVEHNPDPKTTPWIVQWVWEGPEEGSHELVVQAYEADAEVEISPPVVVSVVPEGRLAFASNRDGAYVVYTMEADGRDLSRLTGGPGDARQPAPRKDGVLAYVAETEDGRSMIRQLGSEGETDQDLVAGVDPAWALDGNYLAYAATQDGVSQVFAAPGGSGAPWQVTAEEGYAGKPTWSPDGTRLAYVAEQEGNWDIWSAPVDGGEPQRLTDEPGMDWGPAWSPDGSILAFVSDRGGSHQIYVMNSDGTGVRMLSNLRAGAEAPAWSPDGLWLAFVAYTGDGNGINAREIYLMRSDGQNQVRLTYNSSDDTDVAWSWIP